MKRRSLPRRKRCKPKYRFTREDCQRGYQAALAKCMEDWDLLAWFLYRVRGWYRHKRGSIPPSVPEKGAHHAD
jgi:hypothetical protein